MNRRKFLTFLASLPVLGALMPKAASASPEQSIAIPGHFPRNLVVIDRDGKAHPVPVVVVDDPGKYPDSFVKKTKEHGRIVFVIQLPLLTVSKDGLVVTAYCYYHEDFNQITEQLLQHYNRRIGSVANNLPTIQNVAWPDHFHRTPHLYSATLPESLHILKWRMYLTLA